MTPHNTSQEELLKELQNLRGWPFQPRGRQRLERYGENKLAEKKEEDKSPAVFGPV